MLQSPRCDPWKIKSRQGFYASINGRIPDDVASGKWLCGQYLGSLSPRFAKTQVDFFQQEGLTDLHALTKPVWVQFLGSLKTAGLSSSSIARCLAAIRGFYKHIALSQGNGALEGIIKGTPKQWVQLPKLLSEAEVTRLLNLPVYGSSRRSAGCRHGGIVICHGPPRLGASQSGSGVISTSTWVFYKPQANGINNALSRLAKKPEIWWHTISRPFVHSISKPARPTLFSSHG